MKNLAPLLFVVLFGLASFMKPQEKIVRLFPASLKGTAEYKVPIFVDIQDTLNCDTLIEHRDKYQNTLMFSRKILTGVCIEGECRLVNIELFWNPTGRYLGYQIPDGEFLSKTKHKPFIPEEYDRLHKLLADPLSPLQQYTLNELVPVKKDTTPGKVDAVSSATIAAVLDYIVEGAVYTTYTLWHIIYGPTKREIEKITSSRLDAPLILKFLESEKIEDKVWVLSRISARTAFTPELMDTLISIIGGNDVYLSERALNVLPLAQLDKQVQQKLADIFLHTGFLQKRLIIQKLSDAPVLDDQVTGIIASHLNELNGTLIKSVMEMFVKHEVNDDQAIAESTSLLSHDNRYIAGQAAKYLESLESPDSKTRKAIEKYRKKQ